MWQKTWESHSQRLRPPVEPSTTNNCWPSRLSTVFLHRMLTQNCWILSLHVHSSEQPNRELPLRHNRNVDATSVNCNRGTTRRLSALSGPSPAPVVAQRPNSPQNCTCEVFTVPCTVRTSCTCLCNITALSTLCRRTESGNQDVGHEELLELVQHGHRDVKRQGGHAAQYLYTALGWR